MHKLNSMVIPSQGQGWFVLFLMGITLFGLPQFPACGASPVVKRGPQVVVENVPAGSESATDGDTSAMPTSTTAHFQRKLLSAETVAPGVGASKVKVTTTVRKAKAATIQRQRLQKQIVLPFKTTYQFSARLRPGIRRVIQEGVAGSSCQTIDIGVRNGKVVERKVIQNRVLAKPVDRIVVMGERDLMPSRGRLPARKILVMQASSYSPDPQSCGKYADGYTSIGLRAGYGVVAVDPRIIPLGSRLFVEGYGYAVAADVGGAIKGLRIDVGYDTHRRAIQFGRRTVRVHVLD